MDENQIKVVVVHQSEIPLELENKLIVIFKSKRSIRDEKGKVWTTTRKVIFDKTDGHITVEAYTIGPKGGLSTGTASGFTTEEFGLITGRIFSMSRFLPHSHLIPADFFYPEND
jgi:hypothetical protein